MDMRLEEFVDIEKSSNDKKLQGENDCFQINILQERQSMLVNQVSSRQLHQQQVVSCR